MNIKPVFTRYDINRKIPLDASSPIVVDHVEDYDTRFIEVYVYNSASNTQINLNGTTVIARIVAALSTENVLLKDDVTCTVTGSGTIIIPIDGAVIQTLASTLLIEVRITQGEQVLVLPFPLYVQMRGSILDNAGVTPESQGTIPELLEAAQAALQAAEQAIETFPIVSAEVNEDGTITFTQRGGGTITTTGASVIGPQGDPGQDYVLTNQDKSDIADIVLGELPTTEGVLYGN